MREKATRGGEREKWGTTDKAQAFDPSRPTDFGVWSSYPLPNQLSPSNGIPSLVELSLLLSSTNCGGYLLQAKENPDANFLHGCFAWQLDSVGNTRLLLMPKCCLFQGIFFFWRVVYALEENILTEQMWFLPLISYCESRPLFNCNNRRIETHQLLITSLHSQ